MEAAFKIPSDLPLLSQFRDLASALGGNVGKAYHIFFLVWQDLYLRAQEGAPKGRLPGAAVPSLLRSLAEVEPDDARRRELFDEAIVAQSRLLVPDGPDYVSPRFIILNGQAGVGSRESLGGNRKAFLSRQRKLKGQSFTQGLLVRPEIYVDSDGRPLTGEQTQRVNRLIISCDNALYKPERLPVDYTEGLIQSALLVLAKFEDEEINLIINHISRRRDHPVLNGMVTEKLLPVMGGIVRELG